eukprot:CAMPEP_0183720202 /NCGR_PEP_ID=MMETSP0737-20130205/12887_1 /TAXON_ID=385413 /ORGANISM="Thalassiosira miniscula, Strain CCMP1093" /LENGTH=690 /DNA_ID=CAMNT_0025950039 /DNA_START=131 /DNA_END=2203 /DNA_ORIENTATION=-
MPVDSPSPNSPQIRTPGKNRRPQNANSSASIDFKESILRFLLLPNHVFLVLLLEFLNSFRSFGLRFVQYNYITNEFGISDTQAGALLGVKSFVDIAFGLAGSILVDIYGVRRVSITALSVAIVGRSLLAFGRSTTALYAALFFFSPCGDALLGVGLYKVALKKLTTPHTRPLAFAMSYASFNLAGALADVLVDNMRAKFGDVNIGEHWIPGVAGVYTPLRQFVVITWLVVLITFFVAYCFLEDWTVIDLYDSEDDNDMNANETINNTSNETEVEGHAGNVMPAKPMVKSHILRRWFPKYYQTLHDHLSDDDEIVREGGNGDGTEATLHRKLPNYKMYRTQQTTASARNSSASALSSPFSGLGQIIHQVFALLRIRNTWRVLIFGFASFTIAMNWTASEMILPPFLERRFGEDIPIYTIQSVNLFGCLILPPIVGATTSGMEDFSLIMPGLWIMATSPIFVAMFPNAAGACVWQVFLTLGEVLWSPRQQSWTATLAPTGQEGLFFAVSSARSVMGPFTDILMGMLNEKYNTNCPECRDQYGHFCGELSTGEEDGENNNLQCASVQESCSLFLDNEHQSCPRTCLECPTWEPTDPSSGWYLLMLISIVTPICVWFFLPFLRGGYSREEKFYGLFSCTKTRFLGVCGVMDDHDSNRRRVDGLQMYGHVESKSFESEDDRERDTRALGEDVEFT